MGQCKFYTTLLKVTKEVKLVKITSED
uniref:Uncharacterized protein n=1 Tax=Lepeophtheirus salmonis TaxID=72036 RepID=A0A0K2T9C7_LEPSM